MQAGDSRSDFASLQVIMDPSRTWKQEGSALASLNLDVPLEEQGVRESYTEADITTRIKAISTRIAPVRVDTMPVSNRR